MYGAHPLDETARSLERLFMLAFGRDNDSYAPEAETMNSGHTEVYYAAAWPGMLKMAEAIVEAWPKHRLTLWRAPGLESKVIPFPGNPPPKRPAMTKVRKRRSAGFLFLGRAACE